MIKKPNFKYHRHTVTSIFVNTPESKWYSYKTYISRRLRNIIKKINFSGELFYPLMLKLEDYFWNAWFISDLKLKPSYLRRSKYKYTPLVSNSRPLRSEYTFILKFFKFFRRLSFDFKILYYLLDTKFNYLWDLILFTKDSKKKLYYINVIKIMKEYRKLWKFFNNSKGLIYPNNYLNNFSSNQVSSTLLAQNFTAKDFFVAQKKTILFCRLSNRKQSRSYIFSLPHASNFQKLWLKSSGFDYSLNMFTIHFLRVQRRYNKRRYSKVRLYSRPSFFGGVCLGGFFINCFWGGTMKSVDWYVTIPVIIDMNVILAFLSILTISRLLITDFSISTLRNLAKIRIFRFLKLFVGNSIMQKIFKIF